MIQSDKRSNVSAVNYRDMDTLITFVQILKHINNFEFENEQFVKWLLTKLDSTLLIKIIEGKEGVGVQLKTVHPNIKMVYI